MRVVITGATGFVGQALAKKLQSEGSDILVVGRDLVKLKKIYPNFPSCNYDSLGDYLRADDCVVHLATVNNDGVNSEAEFVSGNVKLLESICDIAVANKARKLIFSSSAHALSDRSDLYSISKRNAETVLRRYEDHIDIRIIRLPAIVGKGSRNKTKYLNFIPSVLLEHIVRLMMQVVPVISISEVCSQIADLCKNGNPPPTNQA